MEAKQDCANCGSMFSYEYSGGRRRKHCSDRCRYNFRAKEKWIEAKEARGGHKVGCSCCGKMFECEHKRKYCSDKCRIRSTRIKRMRAKCCESCGVQFCNMPGGFVNRCCSDQCSHELQLANWKRQAVKRRKCTSVGEKFTALEIFVRDGWRCKCCGIKTPKEKRGSLTDKKAPELDHVIPISVGGRHTRENVQLLCKLCNSAKGNRSAADQIMLFG